MTTYFWEKKESAGSWVPFEGTPTAQNPTEDFDAGTWDVRVTASLGSQSDTKTRNAYVTVEEAPSYVGPLDLVPGAVVAYGVRALSAAMLGQNIFRLRRSSDDAEQDFASDAVTGEAPAAAIATFLAASDGFVVTWYDQSGNGRNATQATEFAQPQYSANETNGKPTFAGTDSVLSTAGNVACPIPMTALLVAKNSSGGNFFGSADGSAGGDHALESTPRIDLTMGSPTAGYLGVGLYSDSFSNFTSCATSANPAATLANYFVAGMTLSDSQDGTVRLNGTLQSVTNERSGTITPFSNRLSVFDCDPDHYNGFIGNIAELLIYDSLVSAGNILSVNQNQGTYFGVTITP